jgi:very-short-patch-repair endonuclease
MGNNLITEVAKELRQRQTEAEEVLWSRLRNKQLGGVKFRRQEPIGSFIVDFVCFREKLVLEIDGSPHRQSDVKDYDEQRTLWLQSQGFRVLRFWNNDILNDVDSVLERIKSYLKR